MGFLLYYLYSITVCSAAPQTTLWRGIQGQTVQRLHSKTTFQNQIQ